MSWRMIKAEWLKLRKRRGLFWWSLGLSVGVVALIFGVIEVLHLANPAQHGPAGGLTGVTRGLIGLYSAGGVAAILVGSFAGTADVSSGVFRDLVATVQPLARHRHFRGPVARGTDFLHTDNHARVYRCRGVLPGLPWINAGCQCVRDRSRLRVGTAGHRV